MSVCVVNHQSINQSSSHSFFLMNPRLFLIEKKICKNNNKKHTRKDRGENDRMCEQQQQQQQ
jgi:hypothetical protein